MLASTQPAAPRSSRRARPASELRASLVTLLPELKARALRLSRCPSVADDLVQDTVERAMRFEQNYIPGTNARAWLFQILFSVFITRCRRSRRENRAIGSLTVDPCAWTAQDAAPTMSALAPALSRRLADLPESFRRAVELVDLGELSYRDAADKMGVPVGTVMSRLHRGRKLLAASLTPANDLDLAA